MLLVGQRVIKKTMTLALTAGAAALTFSSPAVADDALDPIRRLADSSTVSKTVVQKPQVNVDNVVGAVSKLRATRG